MTYNYIQENYEDVSNIDKNLLIFDVSNESIDPGIKAAQIAIKDIGVKEDFPGSRTGVRINQYLQNVGCRPGLGEWSAGAIATWYKEAGLPIPPTNASSATGWYNWAKKTNRWFETPIIGSVVVYGTLDYDYDKDEDVYNAHHLGLVVQIIEQDNIIISCENVNGEISTSIVNIGSALGYIIPSQIDIKSPEVSYTEPPDPAKRNNTNNATDYTVNVKDILKDYIKEVVDKVLINGDTEGRCPIGTYNHAYQFVRKLQGKTAEPGQTKSPEGSPNTPGYHNALQSKLGYTKVDYGVVSHSQLEKYLNDSNSWNIGDVAAYWAVTGVPKDKHAYTFGHTQIFTGGFQNRSGGSKWATDNRRNYACSFVYRSAYPTATWRFLRFNAPVSKYIN